MRFTNRLAITVLCAAAALQAGQNDWLIVPGVRIGPITRNTTHGDLDQIFGKANVVDEPVDTGEGPVPATVINKAKPDTSLVILWTGDHIRDVMICFPDTTKGCKWHTAEGVTIGTGVEQLQSLNARPFVMEPWGSDLGGGVASWKGGKLSFTFGEGLSRIIFMSLEYPESPEGPTSEQQKWVNNVSGPNVRTISSNDEAVRHLHPVVERLSFAFHRE